MWWLGHAWIADRNLDWIGGTGYGGQRLFVVPSLDLVVAVTAGAYPPHGLPDVTGNAALAMTLHAAFTH